VLAFDTAVKPGTLAGRTSCQVKGLAERIEVEVLQGAARDAACRAAEGESGSAVPPPLRAQRRTTEVVRCRRPLPNEAEVSLVLERGIEAGSGLGEQRAAGFPVSGAPGIPGACHLRQGQRACRCAIR